MNLAPADDGLTAPTRVPPQALLLSLLSLAVPIYSSSLFPEWTTQDVGVLIWLLALIPPFLLSYYRGWRGASLALAGGMAAVALSQVGLILTATTPPRPEFMLGVVVVLIGVAMGSGVLSTVLQQSLERAGQMALTDAGTGMPNRRRAMMHLERAFAAAQRGSALTVLLFDLDRFKQVNDTYGHNVGDLVLREFGEVLTGLTRAMHLSARFGGEEFIFILDESDAQGALVLAEKVRKALKERTFPCGPVTVSGGIAQYEPGMASPEVLIGAADQALYRAKEAGRDRVVVMGEQGLDDDQSPEPVREAATSAAGPEVEGRGELVLVVDDDPAVLRVLSRGLRRRRFHPIEASDPHHALEIARGLSEPLDLVITDVVMPGMSGFRLVEMLMEIQPELRALYISGYSREEVRWSGVPGTVKAFLPKPVLLDALTRAARKVLNAPLRGRVRREPAPHFRGRAALQDRLTAQAAQLEEAQGEILARLAWAAEYRDDVTGSHAERVSWLAGRLARELGHDHETVGRIEKAALLHDLGKIGVPDAVLRKPGTLTGPEEAVMQQHCLVGARILSGSRHPLLREAELVARSHHERWDGDGYPQGLRGEDIPLSARITAVADTLDSLTHDRPYRSAVTREAALAIIREERARQFDPAVVDALLRLEERGEVDALGEVAEAAGEWIGDVPDAAPTVRVAAGAHLRR